VAGALLTGCSDDSSGTASQGAAGPTDAGGRALAFAKCMRENGVAKFPDPGDDGDQLIGKDSGVDPQAPEFLKAQEACKDLMPQGKEGEKGGKPADLAKARVWAQCVRDNGEPKFPDPQIDGDTAVVDMTGVPDGEGAPLDKALEICQDKRPSGNLAMRRKGGGQ
jgi:hypothetical protein